MSINLFSYSVNLDVQPYASLLFGRDSPLCQYCDNSNTKQIQIQVCTAERQCCDNSIANTNTHCWMSILWQFKYKWKYVLLNVNIGTIQIQIQIQIRSAECQYCYNSNPDTDTNTYCWMSIL